MPIRKELRHLYGQQWRKQIRPRILERDGHRCKNCGKPNHEVVLQITDPLHREMWWIRNVINGGDWRQELVDRYGVVLTRNAERIPLQPGREVRVVLTVAHLDHDARNMDDSNLAALCQWCHLNHDREQHTETRQHRKDSSRPLLSLLDTTPNGGSIQ